MCGGLFAGCAARVGFNGILPALLVLMASLLALAAIDLELLILPKVIVYPSLVMLAVAVTIDAGATGQWHRLLIAGVCAVGWFVFFFILNFVSPRALGFGDVRLAPLIGLGLGWFGIRYVLLGFFAGNLVGAIIGLILISMKKMSRSQPIPYGVFLAIGACIAIYAGPELLAPFRNYG
jgi:leader peptidase (prepilin peptidase)/N-methyltransferase